MIFADMKDGKAEIRHSDNPVQVAVEVAVLVSNIYNSLKANSELAAELFQLGVIRMLRPSGEAWNPLEGQVIVRIPKQKKWRCPHRSKLGHRI